MQVTETSFSGLCVVQAALYKDERGFFMERFNEQALKANGIDISCFQVNHSFSYSKVIRGLHFQVNPSQKKLVGVTSGTILDVAVDLRKNSKTFQKAFCIKIENPGTMLFIPEGFAHGFSVLSKEGANMIYITEGNYNKEGEGGIIYNDPDLKIDWHVKDPIVSKKDAILGTFADYTKNTLF